MKATFVRVTNWASILPGDVGFVEGSGWLSAGIRYLQPGNPDSKYPTFHPSHVLVFMNTYLVVEAMADLNANSSTAVDLAAPYKPLFDSGRMMVFRPTYLTQPNIQADLMWLTTTFHKAVYPWWNLVGFALQRMLRLTNNPISWGDVCSQIGFLFLTHRYPDALSLKLSDVDPQVLFDAVAV